MSPARNATASQPPNYERHQPEQTLLYQLVQKHYPVFKATLEDHVGDSVKTSIAKLMSKPTENSNPSRMTCSIL